MIKQKLTRFFDNISQIIALRRALKECETKCFIYYQNAYIRSIYEKMHKDIVKRHEELKIQTFGWISFLI